MKGVWHRSLIVKPEKEAVFLDVELSDDILGRKSLEPKGINPGVRSHECYIAGPVACSLFVHQHLLGRPFPEHIKPEFRLSGLTCDGVLHVKLFQFRHTVVHHIHRPEQSVQKRYLVLIGVVDVVTVAVHDGIDAEHSVLNILESEIAPVIGFHRRDRTFKKDR